VNKAIMQMDETTQQNAALVEETTSASQSMKEQARELMRQVDVFKIDGASDASHVKREAHTSRGASDSGTKYASRTTPRAAASKGVNSQSHMSKQSLGGAKLGDGKEPGTVTAGGGKDRSSEGAEFEEF
jgi:methyl-accepting chemotaxis protein